MTDQTKEFIGVMCLGFMFGAFFASLCGVIAEWLSP